MSKILVIVPHGDDEVLLCGGSIVKHLESGDEVTCVFTKAARNVRTELQLDSTEIVQRTLGYQNRRHLHLNLETMTEYVSALDHIISAECPDIVYTTFGGDMHQDHRTTYDAVVSACRVWAPKAPRQILCGEILSSTDQAPQSEFSPNYYNVLDQSHIEKKMRAMSEYHSELKKFPHPRSKDGIDILAKKRGMECGHNYAESFVCIRNIIP